MGASLGSAERWIAERVARQPSFKGFSVLLLFLTPCRKRAREAAPGVGRRLGRAPSPTPHTGETL